MQVKYKPRTSSETSNLAQFFTSECAKNCCLSQAEQLGCHCLLITQWRIHWEVHDHRKLSAVSGRIYISMYHSTCPGFYPASKVQNDESTTPLKALIIESGSLFPSKSCSICSSQWKLLLLNMGQNLELTRNKNYDYQDTNHVKKKN